ncbi:unnamed protein product, partial [Porites lobata]
MADAPSRTCSDLDCMLSEQAWNSVERRFGPHSFDLMALDSNCRRDPSGLILPHYSPWPTPASEGVNAFAQLIPLEHNIYAFPPFVLLGPLLRYFLDQGFHGALTLVVPDLRPRRFWWALLQSVGVDRLLLGRKGDDAALLFPSRSTHIPRPWKPARLCGSCLYPNDADANFCQACGVPTAPLVPAVPRGRGPVDEKVIQERFQEFKSSFERRPYQRQKSALEQQLSTSLASVSPPKTISSCTVDDVIKFLTYKDSSGRTVVHVPTCSGEACACPRRLAAGTVDSLLGKLRSIFNKLGRTDHTNPIAHPRIKEYLNFVRVEQAGMAISPSQAVPLFFV